MTKTTKIGIATNGSYGGAGDAIVLNNNDGAWKDKVGDIRQFLQYFDGIDQHEHHVTLLTFSAGGCYLTLLAGNGGRADFKSVWIYLPNDIILSDDDIEKIYSYATSYLFDPQGKRDSSEEQIIYKDFGTKEHPIAYAPSAVPDQGQRPNEKLAVRYYRSDHTNQNLPPTLKELIGRKIYQEYYSQYERVFLLPQDGAVTINPRDEYRFKDISRETLLTYTIIIPPTTDELNTLGNGTQIVFNGEPFTDPRRVVSGTYDFTLRRQGFNDETIKVPVDERDEQEIVIPKYHVVWKKPITADMFSVCDEDGNKLSGCEITVNGRSLTTANVVLTLTEEECKKARVVVTKKGYDTYNGTHNLLDGKIAITLIPEMIHLKCKITLSNGKNADVTFSSRYLSKNSEESPIKGYEVPMMTDKNGRQKRSDTLELSSLFILKKRAEGFLAAAAVAIVIWCAIGIHDWAYEHTLTWNGILPHIEKVGSPNRSSYDVSPSGGTDSTGTQDDQQKADDNNEASGKEEDPAATESNDSTRSKQDTQSPVSSDTSDEAAMNYLKNNTQWTKDELEKYPRTKGLYQEMINYNFQAILKRNISVMTSLGIKDVCDALKDVPVGNNKYTDDGTITVNDWKEEASKLKTN